MSNDSQNLSRLYVGDTGRGPMIAI